MFIYQMLLAYQYLCLSGFTTVIGALWPAGYMYQIGMAVMAEAGNFQNKVHICTGRGEEGL